VCCVTDNNFRLTVAVTAHYFALVVWPLAARVASTLRFAHFMCLLGKYIGIKACKQTHIHTAMILSIITHLFTLIAFETTIKEERTSVCNNINNNASNNNDSDIVVYSYHMTGAVKYLQNATSTWCYTFINA
jgi:hypothetical protein